MILTTMVHAEGKELDFLLCIRIQCHDIKSICCKSEFSKIISSVSAVCYICRETLIPLGFLLFFFFFFKERDAAVLVAKSKCSRADLRWKVAGGNGGSAAGCSACLLLLTLPSWPLQGSLPTPTRYQLSGICSVHHISLDPWRTVCFKVPCVEQSCSAQAVSPAQLQPWCCLSPGWHRGCSASLLALWQSLEVPLRLCINSAVPSLSWARACDASTQKW